MGVSMDIKISRIASGDEHLDQKWLVLEGSVDGLPVTKRRSIDTGALASGAVVLEDEVAALRADVEEYVARWEAVQSALGAIG